MTTHPNAEILKAIADGKKVQYRVSNIFRPATANWADYDLTKEGPNPIADKGFEWRIKQESNVHYTQMLSCNGKPVQGSLHGYDIDRILNVMKSPNMMHSMVFKPHGLLAITHEDDGTIAKIEYFSQAELKNKGWL